MAPPSAEWCRREEEERLIGTWTYGTLTPSTYTISRTEKGELCIEEQLSTGKVGSGTLKWQGRWLQTTLATDENKNVATIRLRFNEDQGIVVSNIKSPKSVNGWGRDVTSRRVVTVGPSRARFARRDKEAAAADAGELLSRFFDNIEAKNGSGAGTSGRSARGGAARRSTTSRERSCAIEALQERARAVPTALAAMAPAETARLDPAVDPLAPYGYSVNRLKVAADSSSMVCAESIASGAPLLVLPLTACWTATTAAAECPAVARALSEAADRSPLSDILRSGTTWIALHLIHEMKLGEDAKPPRAKHLSMLPKEMETMLAWSARDLEGLRGSRWLEKAKQHQVQVATDFARLAAELGPEVVAELRLDEGGYFWARQVIQEFGISFSAKDGSPMEVLAPGLDLLQPDEATPPSSDGARLEFGMESGPALVVYATHDYQPGDKVALSHGGLACSSGLRLLGCGQTLEANPWDSVELVLKLPVAEENVAPKAKFWKILEGLDAGLRGPQDVPPGSCVPAEVADSKSLVQVVHRRGQPEVQVTIQFRNGKLLPDQSAMWHLGIVLLAHPDRMEKVLVEEKGVVNPLGLDACERRALVWISKRIQWALQEYPSRPEKDIARLMEGHSGGMASRRVRGLRVVAAEKQIFMDAMKALEDRLAAPAAPEATLPAADGAGMVPLAAELLTLRAGATPGSGTELGRAVAQLRTSTRALEQVGDRFKALISGRDLNEAAGMALHQELDALSQLLANSPLEPLAAETVPMRSTKDVVVQACGEAYRAAATATLAGLEWDAAVARKDGDNGRLSARLFAAGTTRTRMLDFGAAAVDLQRSLEVSYSEETAYWALLCASTAATRSEGVLATAAVKGSEVTLRTLREKMRDLGYMKAGQQWPWPRRLPPVGNLSESIQAAWSPGMQEAQGAVQPGPGGLAAGHGWKVEGATKDLHLLIKLFALRQAVPLSKVVALLGPDQCRLLLECSALSCCMTRQGKLAEPKQAAEMVSRSPRDSVDVIANVALWPVDDDVVVAVDFDQGVCVEDQFEPVMYLGEDSRSLVAAVLHQPSGKRALDICCGSGALGLVALKHSAERATFLDSNPRAMRFAAFNARLNGLEDRATFVEGSIGDSRLSKQVGGSFDIVLAGLPFLPNPDTVITSSGPALVRGGADGEEVFAATLSKASSLLAPGGSLMATAVVKDAEGLAARIGSWADSAGSAGLRAMVFQGKAMPLDDCLSALTPGCTEVQRTAYMRGLYHEAGVRTISEAMVLLWAQPAGAAPCASTVELRAEHAALFSDQAYLETELDRLFLAMGATSDQPMYSLDWADAEDCPEGDGTAMEITPAPVPAASPWKPKAKPARKDVGDRGMEGATWDDIVNTPATGFNPPVLCDVAWRKAPGALAGDKAVLPHVYSSKSQFTPIQIALLELDGSKCGPTVKEAVQKLGGKDRILFEKGSSALNVQQNALVGGSGRSSEISQYDVIVVPLVGLRGSFRGSASCDIPIEVLTLLQALYTKVKKRERPSRIVLLTSGCVGPAVGDGQQEGVAAVAPILGLIRTIRVELPQMPIILIDTDTLDGGGDLSGQMFFELELATPKNGIWGVTTQERALMLLSNNRDVAYRKGQRFLPKVDLSPRMPIYVDREVPPLPRATAEGVVVVTGGTGGIGFLAAEALVEAGARTVVLASRSGDVVAGQGIERAIDLMREKGVSVELEACDTSKDREVEKLLGRVRESHGRLSVVVHASGLTDNRPVVEQDASSMRRTFDPKAQGAWSLHKHTMDDDLQAFVMFSSVAALQGSKGQSNYAMANTYLDELARFRVAQGLPAVSVQWPPVDLLGRAPNSDQSVGAGTVKQVVKQMVCGLEPVEPVQAVLTRAFLASSAPILSSMLEPLLARANPEAQAGGKVYMAFP